MPDCDAAKGHLAQLLPMVQLLCKFIVIQLCLLLALLVLLMLGLLPLPVCLLLFRLRLLDAGQH
jgi:hypothetical protein